MFDEIQHPVKRAFLAAYSTCASIRKAAEYSDIDRSTHYVWMREDPLYAEAFETAKVLAAESLEDEAVRRAHEGTLKPVYQGGKLVGHINEYSDTLMIFLLKGKMPEKYRERYEQHLTGKDGGPIELVTDTREQFLSRIAGLAARTAETPGSSET